MLTKTHFFLLLFFGVGAFRLSAQKNQVENPLTPTETPACFAPGLISIENPEFGGTLHPDGHRFWFNRTSPDRQKMTLLETHWQNGQWSLPNQAPFSDTLFREIDPCISPDGGLLLFSSNRPLPGTTRKDYNLWCWQPGETAARPLSAALNSADDEIFASVCKEGSVYFARFRGNKSKIFAAKRLGNDFQVPEQLNLPSTDTASISNPAISPDEQFLVFASAQLGGVGAADLFVARKMSDGTWAAPRNLGTRFNTEAAEFAPAFSADGRVLFFTSERPGVVQDFPAGQRRPGDIYAVSFDAEKIWTEVAASAKHFPKIHISTDSVHLVRLREINRDIWTPFAEAYAAGDAERYIALHLPDFIRAGIQNVKNLAEYRTHSQKQFARNAAAGRRCEIAFTFFERVAGPETASERGIYRYTAIGSDGSRQHFYGKFHVFLRKVAGTWKILVDYDSDEDETIGEADFWAGLPPDVFK